MVEGISELSEGLLLGERYRLVCRLDVFSAGAERVAGVEYEYWAAVDVESETAVWIQFAAADGVYAAGHALAGAVAALRRINHPAVPAVHAFGEYEFEHAGQVASVGYCAIPVGAGETLAAALLRSELDQAEILAALGQIAEVLELLAEFELVHGHLSAHSVLLNATEGAGYGVVIADLPASLALESTVESELTAAADVYALAWLIVLALVGPAVLEAEFGSAFAVTTEFELELHTEEVVGRRLVWAAEYLVALGVSSELAEVLLLALGEAAGRPRAAVLTAALRAEWMLYAEGVAGVEAFEDVATVESVESAEAVTGGEFAEAAAVVAVAAAAETVESVGTAAAVETGAAGTAASVESAESVEVAEASTSVAASAAAVESVAAVTEVIPKVRHGRRPTQPRPSRETPQSSGRQNGRPRRPHPGVLIGGGVGLVIVIALIIVFSSGSPKSANAATSGSVSTSGASASAKASASSSSGAASASGTASSGSGGSGASAGASPTTASTPTATSGATSPAGAGFSFPATLETVPATASQAVSEIQAAAGQAKGELSGSEQGQLSQIIDTLNRELASGQSLSGGLAQLWTLLHSGELPSSFNTYLVQLATYLSASQGS